MMDDKEVNDEVRKAYFEGGVPYRRALKVLNEKGNPYSIHTVITRANMRDHHRMYYVYWGLLIAALLVGAIIVALAVYFLGG